MTISIRCSSNFPLLDQNTVILLSIPKNWYCPNCRLQKKFQKPRRALKTQNTSQQNSEVMKLDRICVCGTKPSVNDKLLKCHSLDGQNGKYFHLNCLDYKRMPNYSQTTWLCSSCKEKVGSTRGKNAKSIPHVSTNIDSHFVWIMSCK